MSFTLYNLAKHTYTITEKNPTTDYSFLAICLGYPGATISPDLFVNYSYSIEPHPYEFTVIDKENGIDISIEVLPNSTFRKTCDYNKQILYYYQK
jgi:hypothetical protein